jgi:hypothetical protein
MRPDGRLGALFSWDRSRGRGQATFRARPTGRRCAGRSLGVGVVEVEAAHAAGGIHGAALGEGDADFLFRPGPSSRFAVCGGGGARGATGCRQPEGSEAVN